MLWLSTIIIKLFDYMHVDKDIQTLEQYKYSLYQLTLMDIVALLCRLLYIPTTICMYFSGVSEVIVFMTWEHHLLTVSTLAYIFFLIHNINDHLKSKLLGIVSSDDVRWDAHIHHINSKSNKMIWHIAKWPDHNFLTTSSICVRIWMSWVVTRSH